MSRFCHHLVGFPLSLPLIVIAFKIQIQGLAGRLNMFQSPSAMTFVIVIGVFQQNIRVNQFLARRFSINTRRE